jgi:hypothetical protein
MSVIKEKLSILQNDEEKLNALIDYLESISPSRIEDVYQASDRVANAKKALGEQLRQIEQETGESIGDNSVLIVAHDNCLKHFTSATGGFEEGHEGYLVPKNCYQFKNAEIIEFNFSY